jgi:hypothetical protein
MVFAGCAIGDIIADTYNPIKHHLFLKAGGMQKKFTELSFIIGLFFTVVSLILLVGYLTSPLLSSNKNLYSGMAFLVFGVFMMLITKENKAEQ